MKKIKLTQGKFALVDDKDFDWLNQFKWCVNSKRYVMNRGSTMHKMIMQPPEGYQVDHINGDRFDNRRSNLRLCTVSQNCANRVSRIKPKSGYRGVTWHSTTKKWRACIKVRQKKISLGLYFKRQQAAQAYNQAAKQYFGEFARVTPLP